MRGILCFTLFLLGISWAVAQDAKTLIEEGIALHDKGEYGLAVEKYLQAIAKEPDNGTAYYEAAFSYHLNRDYDNALKMAEKALEYADEQTKMLAAAVKGSILDDSGRRKESAQWYEKAIKEYPNHYLLFFNYGVTLAGLNRLDDAEWAFISALSNRFTHPGSHLQLANLERSRNKKAKAALGYYFFLLLENETERGKGAFRILQEFYFPNAKDSSKANTIYLTLPPKGEERWSSVELFFNLIGPASKERSQGESEQVKFVSATESFFKMLSESSGNQVTKKKKKRSGQPAADFWWDNYVPFFSDLLSAGHVEAFCYHIMKGQYPEEFERWQTSNKDQLDRFYLWLKTR